MCAVSATASTVPQPVPALVATRGGAIGAMLAACALWGFSYVPPVLVPGTGPMTLVGLRFVAFGVLAVALLHRSGIELRGVPWGRAVRHAIAGCVGYYLCNVSATTFAGPHVTIAVIGMAPLVYTALAARIETRPLRPLLPSAGLVLIGQAVVHLGPGGTLNGAELPHGIPGVLAGAACAATAVALWCWYGFDNAAFLRARPELTLPWASAVGVMTGVLAAPLLVAGCLLESATTPVLHLALVVAVLALGTSWGATAGFNVASARLPRTLTGQLLALEPTMGFVWVHLLTTTAPVPSGVVGQALLVTGCVLAVRAEAGARSAHDPAVRDHAATLGGA